LRTYIIDCMYNELVSPKKTKKIVVRVSPQLKEFIDNFARENGMNTSEFVRRVLIYFNMAYILGKLTEPLPKIREQFFKMLDEIEGIV